MPLGERGTGNGVSPLLEMGLGDWQLFAFTSASTSCLDGFCELELSCFVMDRADAPLPPLPCDFLEILSSKESRPVTPALARPPSLPLFQRPSSRSDGRRGLKEREGGGGGGRRRERERERATEKLPKGEASERAKQPPPPPLSLLPPIHTHSSPSCFFFVWVVDPSIQRLPVRGRERASGGFVFGLFLSLFLLVVSSPPPVRGAAGGLFVPAPFLVLIWNPGHFSAPRFLISGPPPSLVEVGRGGGRIFWWGIRGGEVMNSCLFDQP